MPSRVCAGSTTSGLIASGAGAAGSAAEGDHCRCAVAAGAGAEGHDPDDAPREHPLAVPAVRQHGAGHWRPKPRPRRGICQALVQEAKRAQPQGQRRSVNSEPALTGCVMLSTRSPAVLRCLEKAAECDRRGQEANDAHAEKCIGDWQRTGGPSPRTTPGWKHSGETRISKSPTGPSPRLRHPSY